MKGAFVPGMAMAMALAGPARAVLVEHVDVVNKQGSFVFDSGRASLDETGMMSYFRTPHTVFNADGTVDSRTELRLNLLGYASEQSGEFFFLHDNLCVGMCAVGSSTEITFTIHNDGSTAQNLRFDSLITPGHLARLGTSSSSQAGFDFKVTQDPDTTTERDLYTAIGRVTNGGMSVTTTDGRMFNGMTDLIQSDNWAVKDWGATNLNLNLGSLGAGETTVVRYEAIYYATNFDSCVDLASCSGAQVVFGDPRTNGGGTNLMRMAALAGQPTRDAINEGYKDYATTFAVVDADDPLPEPPEDMPVLSYNRGFTPLSSGSTSSVPEPASWVVMLLGMGMVGTGMRSQRTGAPARHGAPGRRRR